MIYRTSEEAQIVEDDDYGHFYQWVKTWYFAGIPLVRKIFRDARPSTIRNFTGKNINKIGYKQLDTNLVEVGNTDNETGRKCVSICK